MSDMNELVPQLAVARKTLEAAQEQMQMLLAEFQATQEYQNAAQVKTQEAERVAALEEQIRNEGVAIFKESGSKHPHPAVEIKLFKTVTVKDEGGLREWCFANFRPALKLDSASINKAAKDGNIPVNYAEVFEEPRAQIATKLE